jgi:hypothetical protein
MFKTSPLINWSTLSRLTEQDFCHLPRGMQRHTNADLSRFQRHTNADLSRDAVPYKCEFVAGCSAIQMRICRGMQCHTNANLSRFQRHTNANLSHLQCMVYTKGLSGLIDPGCYHLLGNNRHYIPIHSL